MKHRHSRKPSEHVNIARNRIKELFRQADLAAKDRMDLANRYVTLARKISMKYKVKIPPELRRKFCRHCYKYMLPGKTSRVRIAKQRVIYYCLNCRKFMRFV
ncbi:MAG: ribonuclease P, partial [Nanoarchaeota archaeon]|nr:ribonuclease P [Nanoarchaeota archaeon]